MTLWAQLIICALFIAGSGYKLSYYADEISKNSRISAGIMGVLLLAAITSCPEIVTSLGSITIVDAPDIAAGDLLGAVIINVFVIALLAVLSGKGSILKGQSRSNIITAALTILVLMVIMASIGLRRSIGASFGILNVGFGTISIGLIYVIGMSVIYKHEANAEKGKLTGNISMPVKVKFLAAAIVIISSGLWLAVIGKEIAGFYRWNEMYVGIVLVAIVTTMPEFWVSFFALKQGSPAMAVGNLLGSNFFNLFIFAFLDVFFRKGEFFSYISRANMFPALLGALLTLIALVAMLKRPVKKTAFAWDTAIIIAVFFCGHYLIFNMITAAKW